MKPTKSWITQERLDQLIAENWHDKGKEPSELFMILLELDCLRRTYVKDAPILLPVS